MSDEQSVPMDPFLTARGRSELARPIGRREFVRATSGLLVATAFGSACADPSSVETGTVSVSIQGLGPGLTTAGQATISGDGIAPITFDLPPLDSVQQSVTAGNYNVVYSPPAGYTVAPGTSNQQAVIVLALQTTEVGFSVVQASGTIRVTISGLVGATLGGNALAARTDVVNQTPQAIVVPASGTIDTSVLPGNYSVSFVPPSGYQLAVGQAASQSANVVTGGTAIVNFAVVQVAAPTGIIFSSDWTTALGNTDAALRDTGKASAWSIRGSGDIIVVASTGLDFPTQNVLRINSDGGSGGILRKTGLPIPAVGESRWYRWYLRQTHVDGLADNETHPMQDGNAASDTNWMFKVYHNAGGAGHWTPQLWAGNGIQAWPNTNFTGPVLDKHVTYRVEVQAHRVGATTYQLHIRIYNSANTLIAQDSDFQNGDNSGTLAGNPTLTFRDVNNLGGLNVGSNGIFPAHSSAFLYGYQGGIAVSASGWIGPYAGGV